MASEPSMLTLLVLGIVVCALTTACMYSDRCFGTTARNDLPGPKGIPLIGNMLGLWKNRRRVLMYLGELESRYGELFTITSPGWGRNIIINRPEWLEHIRRGDAVKYGKGEAALSMFREFPGPYSPFSTEGDVWRQSRKMIHPVFASKRFNNTVLASMEQLHPVYMGLLDQAAISEVEVDFNNFSGRLALMVFTTMSLGSDLGLMTTDSSCLRNKSSLMDSVMVLNQISSGRLYNPFWRITEMFDGIGKKFHSARSQLYDLVDGMITARKRAMRDKIDEMDFLSTLLSNGSASDPNALRDALVTLLFAGRDNTQNALTWSLYEMSRHPEWFERLRIEASKRADGRILTYYELSNFPNHLAVFYETLRLWPGVPKNARIALCDDILPGIPKENINPIPVHKGDYVLWSDYAMMRNEKVWGPTAKEFDPERHLRDGIFVKPTQPKFHAFGAGPRLCPGAQLAAYEFVAIWASILPKFDLTPVEMKERFPSDALTMSLKGDFMIKVSSRG